jgi:hypothetical protein
VRAELAQAQLSSAQLSSAQLSGDIMAGSDRGEMLNEVNPGKYPAKPATQGKTREQVRAELGHARYATSESGWQPNELLYKGR